MLAQVEVVALEVGGLRAGLAPLFEVQADDGVVDEALKLTVELFVRLVVLPLSHVDLQPMFQRLRLPHEQQTAAKSRSEVKQCGKQQHGKENIPCGAAARPRPSSAVSPPFPLPHASTALQEALLC